MAKKKKRRSSRKKQQGPEHALPPGFWSQVGAVALLVLALLLVVAWFGAGGPVVEWIHDAALATIGWAVFALPFLFVYLAVEVFRAEEDENKLPWVMKFASFLFVFELAGLLG